MEIKDCCVPHSLVVDVAYFALVASRCFHKQNARVRPACLLSVPDQSHSWMFPLVFCRGKCFSDVFSMLSGVIKVPGTMTEGIMMAFPSVAGL